VLVPQKTRRSYAVTNMRGHCPEKNHKKVSKPEIHSNLRWKVEMSPATSNKARIKQQTSNVSGSISMPRLWSRDGNSLRNSRISTITVWITSACDELQNTQIGKKSHERRTPRKTIFRFLLFSILQLISKNDRFSLKNKFTKTTATFVPSYCL